MGIKVDHALKVLSQGPGTECFKMLTRAVTIVLCAMHQAPVSPASTVHEAHWRNSNDNLQGGYVIIPSCTKEKSETQSSAIICVRSQGQS
jgi:hypothetical protein